MSKVPLEHGRDLAGERLVFDHGADLEIQAEGAVVEIVGSHVGEVVIDEHDLLMHEAGRIGVEPDAQAPQLVDVMEGCQPDGQAVALARGDDPDLDAPQGRELERLQHRIVRHEVRRGDPQPIPGRAERRDEKQAGGLVLRRGSGGHDQHALPLPFDGATLRSPVHFEIRFSRGPVPVREDGQLQLVDRRPPDSHVRIAPGTEFRVPAQVLVAHVVTAHPAHFPVHHHHFPVIPEIELKLVAPPLRRLEGADLDSRILQ